MSASSLGVSRNKAVNDPGCPQQVWLSVPPADAPAVSWAGNRLCLSLCFGVIAKGREPEVHLSRKEREIQASLGTYWVKILLQSSAAGKHNCAESFLLHAEDDTVTTAKKGWTERKSALSEMIRLETHKQPRCPLACARGCRKSHRRLQSVL